MEKEFTVIIEKGEDNYFIGEVIELPGCHTQAKTLDELMKRMKEAIALYLEVKTEVKIPQFVGVQRIGISVPA